MRTIFFSFNQFFNFSFLHLFIYLKNPNPFRTESIPSLTAVTEALKFEFFFHHSKL